MTIADIQGRSKALISQLPADTFIVLVLILSASASFGLGYLTGKDAPGLGGQGSGIWVENLIGASSAAAADLSAPRPAPVTQATLSAQSNGAYVASRTGKKYYLATCSSAKRITDANKVTFATKAEAEAKGYTPAANCPGL